MRHLSADWWQMWTIGPNHDLQVFTPLWLWKQSCSKSGTVSCVDCGPSAEGQSPGGEAWAIIVCEGSWGGLRQPPPARTPKTSSGDISPSPLLFSNLRAC
eukprot:scaffold1459_cov104-Isochrysis_galbana.AAC.9